MGKVLFISQNPWGRCENMMAVYNAYDGPKEFRHGIENMRSAEKEGFSVTVCDAPPQYIDGKDRCKSIVLCHGITGNKVYGVHEGDKDWIDRAAFDQTDWATAASEASVPIVAGQLGIPEERVLPLGFPRTDAYVGAAKGDGGTLMASYARAYIYAPTYRDEGVGHLPRIDWEKVDSLLGDDEVFVLKRHYYMRSPLLGSDFEHVVEIPPMEPIIPYLIDCDAVLTDYSSVISDAYLLGKRCVLAADDMREYLADRPMYYRYPEDYSSLWLGAEGNEVLLVGTMRYAANSSLDAVDKRYRELTAGACDGHSTERVCGLIAEEAR